MADLKFLEKKDIENALGMGSGYVADFSNNSFAAFIADSIRIDIYEGKYSDQGSSKANHLRSFLAKAPNYLAGRLLHDMIVYAKVKAGEQYSKPTEADLNRFDRCLQIAEKLKRDQVVENIDALEPNTDEEDFSILARSIKDSIEKNQPQVALDRLHTFCMKYFRNLCKKRHADYAKDDNLGNLVGKYVKRLEADKVIEAKITIQIMKSSISIFSDLNHVRNTQSFAHDNPVLNYQESLLIFNHVVNTIKFIDYLEASSAQKAETSENVDLDDDIPF